MGKKFLAVVIPYHPITAALISGSENIDEAVELGNLINKKEGVNTMSNYNEDMAKLFEELGLTGFELRKLTEEEKATPEDWAKLEQRIALRTAENSRMLDVSMFNAKNNSKPTT